MAGAAAGLPTWSGLQAQRPITGLPSGANTIAGAMTDNALAAPPTIDTSPPGRISAEAGRRRTSAAISPPGAGKSPLTDAIALPPRAIHAPGPVPPQAGPTPTGPDR